MGNCVPTTHRFFRSTPRRRVTKDSPMRVAESVEAGEETRISTGHEEIGQATNRMKQATMSENPAKEKEVEVEIESREDTEIDTDAISECSSGLGEFPSLESLCEEYEELEQIKNRIEQENTSEKAVQKKVEDETEIEISLTIEVSLNSQTSLLTWLI
ncbi:unnamed protein product [Rodentolepis nana]|uniref:Uncharacterized protein n=1 Tax=Rodentolepis nana TaxID=102285 RepID=A0A0R3TZD1_RODNA|nr:unnamed protein product [Rodentolepis nana]